MTVGATNALFLAMQVGHGDMDIKLSIETRNFGIVSNLLHVFTCPAVSGAAFHRRVRDNSKLH